MLLEICNASAIDTVVNISVCTRSNLFVLSVIYSLIISFVVLFISFTLSILRLRILKFFLYRISNKNHIFSLEIRQICQLSTLNALENALFHFFCQNFFICRQYYVYTFIICIYIYSIMEQCFITITSKVSGKSI